MTLVSLALVILEFIGVITNFLAFRFIKKTFDCKKSLYAILALDAFLMAIINGFSGLCLGARGLFLETKTTCVLRAFFGNNLQFMLHTQFTFLISFIRFRYTKLDVSINEEMERKTICYSKIFIGYSIFHWFFYILINLILDLRTSKILNMCLGNEATDLKITFIFLMVPLMCEYFSIFYMDWKSWMKFLEWNKNRQPTPINPIDEIPLRASLINGTILLIHIFMMIIFTAISPTLIMINGLELLVSIETIFRTPFIALFAFRVNEQNVHHDAIEERERKRQLEIQEALQKKEQREMAKMEGKEEIFVMKMENPNKIVSVPMPPIEI